MQSIAGMILMVVTSAGQMPDGHETGLWLEEFSVPYEIFTEAGYEVVVASPKGGEVPVDPRSMTDQTRPHNADSALEVLQDTRTLSNVDPAQFDAVFFPGGHGTMFDFPDSPAVQQTVEHFVNAAKPAAFVCHGPAALVGARGPDGTPIVSGRTLTAFTDEEEKAVDLVEAVPFLLQEKLEEQGASFVPAANFREHVVVDGTLVTGQNPASSGKAARELLQLLQPAGEAG